MKSEQIEYSEMFIGECGAGSCDMPATVRVYEDFVLCALHHLYHEIGEEEDEANLAHELIAAWHSMANMHGNQYLINLFDPVEDELRDRRELLKRRQKQLDRIEYETMEEGESGIRAKMGAQARASQQEQAGRLPELSALGRQLIALTRYPGEDLTRFARDMVATAGGPYEADRENVVPIVEARLLSAAADDVPEGFMAALADGLRISEAERSGLARSYVFDEYTPPEQENHAEQASAEPERGGRASA